MKEKTYLEISSWFIVKALLVLILFYLLFVIRDIIALFIVVLILTATFRPTINKWEKHIKRLPAVLALLIIAILMLAFISYIIIPPVLDQTSQLFANLPYYLTKLSFLKNYSTEIKQNLSSISKEFTGGVVSFTAGVFGGVISFLTAVIMTIYLLLDRNGLNNFVKSFFPTDQSESIIEVGRKVAHKVGNWFRGQMILGVIIAAVDLIGLLIIGVPFALSLAIISGVLEIIPTIGPMIAGIIAVLVALADAPWKGLAVLILYVVVQQLENNILVPKIMQKAVGLSPVIIILAILIGAKLLGIVGAILAVPVSAGISVIIGEWPVLKMIMRKNDPVSS